MFAVQELLDIPPSLLRQYRSPARTTARQVAGVAEMVRLAHANVPFYAGAEYSRPIHSLGDLARLPVLTKALILEPDASSLYSTTVPESELVRFQTSGTTGRRLRLAHDRRMYAYHNAACLRRMTATGVYRPWHRIAHLRPVAHESRWYQRMGLFRREMIDCTVPTEQIVEQLVRSRPQAIIGIPVMLREVARSIDPEQRAILRCHVKAVFSESEQLFDEHRALLSEAFDAPVFDEYSAFEVFNVAFECGHGGFHLSEDRLVVEITDELGRTVEDGSEGAVTVTAFMERAMPLVRYALGDRGLIELGSCPCGRTFRRLRLTKGRAETNVVLPDGTPIHVSAFLFMSTYLPGLAECFVRQESDGVVTVYALAEPDWTGDFDQLARAIEHDLLRLAGCDFPIRVERIDRLMVTAGGKGRFMESEYKVAGAR